MPIFDSQYPENSSPVDADFILTTDTSDGKSVKGVKFSSLRNWLISTVKWITRAMVGDGEIPVLRATRVYTASDTWFKPTGMTANGFLKVTVIGGGGGGGGAANAAASALAIGNSGGGGGGSKKTIQAAALGASETVTVGAGGTAGAAGANDGGVGGTSSFGSHLSANGGFGGTGGASSTSAPTSTTNTNGGTATGGDINVTGGASEVSFRFTAVAGRVGLSGASPFGFGMPQAGRGSIGSGTAGLLYGGGGTAGYSSNASGTAAGAAGGAGIVIVEEWY